MKSSEILRDIKKIFDTCLKSGMFHTVTDAEMLVILYRELETRLTDTGESVTGESDQP